MLIEEEVLDEEKLAKMRTLKRFRKFYWIVGYIVLPTLYLILTLAFNV